MSKTNVIKISTDRHRQLLCAESERDNLRRAYNEVNERGELIQNQLKRDLIAVSGQFEIQNKSYEALKADYSALMKTATDFATHKDRDAATIARLVKILEKVDLANEELVRDLHEAKKR